MADQTTKIPENRRLHVEGIGSFMNLFNPRAVKPGDPEFYSLAILFSKEYDLGPLKALIRACAEKKHGKDQSKWPENWKTPIKAQRPGKYAGHVEGAFFVNAKSMTPPGLIMPDAKTYITDPSRLFSGCRVRVSINAYNYDNTGNIGVGIGLGNVQLLEYGEPLGGERIAPELDFEPVADSEMGGKDASRLI